MSHLKIFEYQSIAAAPSGERYLKYDVTPERFERQCYALKYLRLPAVTLSEGLQTLNRKTPARCVVLTFDYAFLDMLTVAAPILKQFGFGATCFVVCATIGGANVHDMGHPTIQKPIMNREQLQSWVAQGNELGSHSITHPHLASLSRDAAEEEIFASKEHLQSLTGISIHHFCYPYGDLNDETISLVKNAGYRSAVTKERGIATRSCNLLRLPRIASEGDTSLAKFVMNAATPLVSLSQCVARSVRRTRSAH